MKRKDASMQWTMKNLHAGLKGRAYISDINWTLNSGDMWLILGGNGSGKTSLGRSLCGEFEIIKGEAQLPAYCESVSFERVDQLLEEERAKDDTDFMDRIDPGTSVGEFLQKNGGSCLAIEKYAALFGFSTLLDRGLKFLSTGELRKVLVISAVLKKPEVLVLDEPFDGLDVASCLILKDLAKQLSQEGMTLVFLINRLTDKPEMVSHIAYMRNGTIVFSGKREELETSGAISRLNAFHFQMPDNLPQIDPSVRLEPLKKGTVLVEMKDVVVRYGDNTILDRINWTVLPGEHWMISGPNGCGKSTLLSLVTGDNPQAYANDISLFGRKRGSGETVWDIKRQMGIISNALQQDYRVSARLIDVVLSGLFDSIGVYNQVTSLQKGIAMEWLKLIHLEDQKDTPLRSLSFGEQRLVLIARGMIKQPRLLVLDEPCQGLDDINREMVLRLVDYLGQTGSTQILYVTHHAEDKVSCITNYLEF